MSTRIIAIASDHAGLELKAALIQDIEALGFTAHDLGPGDAQSVDYPDYADKLCAFVLSNAGSAGVLICGSGVGMSIAANRHAGIRAALCQDALTARLARRHNDANVLCLGQRLIGIASAQDCLKAFVQTEFEGGRHQGRVAKLG